MLGAPLLKLLYKNEGLAGTWSADTEVPTLPASNLADANRNRPHRSTGLASPNWRKVNLGSAKAIGAVALVDPNLSSGLTITVKARATDGDWATPAFSDTFTSWTATRTGVLPRFLAATQTYQWWRVEWADPANPDGYTEVGVITLGPSVAFTRAPGALRYQVVDPSVVGYTPTGTPHRWEREAFTLVEIAQTFTPESLVFGDLQTALREAGMKRDVVLSLFPDGPSGDDIAKATNLYGSFIELPAFAHVQTLAGTDYDWAPAVFRESK